MIPRGSSFLEVAILLEGILDNDPIDGRLNRSSLELKLGRCDFRANAIAHTLKTSLSSTQQVELVLMRLQRGSGVDFRLLGII